ncbi:MAG: DUF971 domain-containing protein [Candidatus Sericytochromatia bacterium]|nr:DUF971 domain-containing protein [Candidatus Sericytochromatia bacterium]
MTKYSTDPIGLKITDPNTIKLTWKDQHESIYDTLKLRLLCPCAECRGGHGGKVGDNVSHIKAPIIVNDYNKIGRYALAFDFSDLHRGGIYSYDYLREICPCEICKGDAEKNYK